MILPKGQHLAYCTNIHRGESWEETLSALERYTLEVKRQVCPDRPYAIGLRLSDLASRELVEGKRLAEFQHWLDRHECYVFTINGFPFGQFHGQRVKEQVYLPDWTSPERVEYTNRLFDILGELLPDGVEGSVSSVPLGFKEFDYGPEAMELMRANVFRCVEHAAQVGWRKNRRLHMALEPEPLCVLETIDECVRFFDQIRSENGKDSRIEEFLGLNYDACHLAAEFEEPSQALKTLQQHEIKVKKLHLSSALKVRPTVEARQELRAFADDTYLHQVIAQNAAGKISRYRDLEEALGADEESGAWDEWRIHFHIPLHCPDGKWFENTTDHLLAVIDALGFNPDLCAHLEMETYTWEVLPPEMKSQNVVEQLVKEYEWTLAHLRARELA